MIHSICLQINRVWNLKQVILLYFKIYVYIVLFFKTFVDCAGCFRSDIITHMPGHTRPREYNPLNLLFLAILVIISENGLYHGSVLSILSGSMFQNCILNSSVISITILSNPTLNYCIYTSSYQLHDFYDGASTLWRHEMDTFSSFLALCEVNPSATGEFRS